MRDMVLGLEPADYDVTTDATPNDVVRLFPKTYAVGAQFGVVLVPVPEEIRDENLPPEHPHAIEVATFRSDGIYSDGRHPDQVQYSKSPQEDVQRRDFTINGLLMDPLDGDRVLDFVGGREDLAEHVVRAIGEPELRFREDKLRMLRAVRFAARFGYVIEPRTFEAIRRFAAEIDQVSRERVRDELTKMLTERPCPHGVQLLDQTGLLVRVLPRLIACAASSSRRSITRRRRLRPHHAAAGASGRVALVPWPGNAAATWASPRRFRLLGPHSIRQARRGWRPHG